METNNASLFIPAVIEVSLAARVVSAQLVATLAPQSSP
jgi:hypothetical protein